jgi:hypothetical protein
LDISNVLRKVTMGFGAFIHRSNADAREVSFGSMIIDMAISSD